jgi:hypothetical protein
VIDGQTLTWKGKGIVLAEVTKVSCWVTKISNTFNYTMQYRIELWAGKDHLKVLWDGKDAQAAATYDSAVATLNQTVVPRLVQKELAAIAATGEAVVAHTRFTRDGISQKKRSASWSEITSIQPVTEARTAVVAGNRAADRAAAVVDHMHPNALVALALVQTCVQTYGRGEQS